MIARRPADQRINPPAAAHAPLPAAEARQFRAIKHESAAPWAASHAPPAQDIGAKMEAELAHALALCEAEVLAFIEPLEQVGGWGVARVGLRNEGLGHSGRRPALPAGRPRSLRVANPRKSPAEPVARCAVRPRS